MRIVLVSYHYGKSGNVAAQRWNHFSDYLKSQGHQVEIIHSGNLRDSLEKNKIQTPTNAVKRNHKTKTDFFKNFNPLFMLIDRQWLWSLKVFRELKKSKFSRDNQDLYIVSGPPWSSMVAVVLAASQNQVKFCIDFRDFWSEEPNLGFKSILARGYFRKLEERAVRKSNLIITVNSVMTDHFSKFLNKKCITIPNGYSGELDWTTDSFNSTAQYEKKILYAGTLSHYHGVAHFLKSLPSPLPSLSFLGSDAYNFLETSSFESKPQVSASEAQAEMSKAGALLLLLSSTSTHYITGKVMSYIKAGRPILYFGPEESPAAELIRSHDLGWVVDSSEPEKLKEVLKVIQNAFDGNNKFNFTPDLEKLSEYSVDHLGKVLDQALTTLSKGLR